MHYFSEPGGWTDFVDLALSPCGVLLAQKAYYFPGVQSTPLSQKIKKQQLQSELYLAAQKKKLDSIFNINHVLLLCTNVIML